MLAKIHFIRSLFLCAVVISIVSACSATGPSYVAIKSTIPQLQSDKARMYFLRDSGFVNSGLIARVHLDGTLVANLGMDGFAYVDHPAGDALIMIDAPLNIGEARKTVNLEGGKTYYFFVANDASNVMAGTFGGIVGAASEGGGRFAFYRIPDSMGMEKLKTKKLSGN